MREGVTEISHKVFDLHMLILWVCIAIGVVVFGVMFWSMFAYRKSRGAKASKFHESTTVEIIWTAIPFVILIGMAIPATGTLIEMYDTNDSEIDIKITGYQWKWRYDYLKEDFGYFSVMETHQDELYNRAEKGEHYLLDVDEPVVVPVGKKIRFLVTAADVIHSWWVPDIAVKRDAIPGYINESWTRIDTPGTYRGQCTELCGKDHGFMPVVVKAVEQAEYDEWVLAKQEKAKEEFELQSKEWTLAELTERGEAVYAKNCAGCHQANGQGLPPTFPSLVGQGLAVGAIEAHAEIVIKGSPGTSMPAFGGQLSDVDIAAVVTYERNAWGNDLGDMLEPKDVSGLK
ncbi:cytochrome c oxidase subunit II [Allohahella marinimesophila]|uniref:Cytochrome c oxidase subunit 2 n=2 Tax=Allohahella marinimesophila TaxID=1054972 RepID=A0ABP7PCR5_9GAMM